MVPLGRHPKPKSDHIVNCPCSLPKTERIAKRKELMRWIVAASEPWILMLDWSFTMRVFNRIYGNAISCSTCPGINPLDCIFEQVQRNFPRLVAFISMEHWGNTNLIRIEWNYNTPPNIMFCPSKPKQQPHTICHVLACLSQTWFTCSVIWDQRRKGIKPTDNSWQRHTSGTCVSYL